MARSRLALLAAGLYLLAPNNAPAAEPGGDGGTRMTETSPETARIRPRGPEDMSPEERAAFEADPQKFLNLSRLFALAPTMAPGLGELTKGMTSLAMPHEEREIVAFAVLNLERGEWELAQHREVVKMMGIAPAKVDAVAHERYGDPAFTDRERALLAFTRQVVKCVRVDDPTFHAVAAFYDRRQLVETLFVIGTYMMLARISEVAELPIESTSGANFWKNEAKK
jgi:alkylhydroperoxidase family enzyme